MATCIDTINNTENIEFIESRVDYNFKVNADTNKLFKFYLNTSQVIYLKVNLKALNKFKVISVSIIDENKNTLRTSKVKEDTIISADLNEGNYYICFRTLFGNFDINASIDYLKYTKSITFSFNGYYGIEGLLRKFKNVRPPRDCNRPLKYTLIGGKLPTGLKMDSSGRIYGQLPIIDHENLKDFPSYNLYHSNFDYATPIGVRYEFTVKLEVMGDTNDEVNYAVRTFCIMLVNDWSLTEPFMLGDVESVSGYVEVKNTLPASLCPPCILPTNNENNKSLYVFTKDGALELVKKITNDNIWTLNEHGSISKGNYVSKAPFIKRVVQLDYVINAYESGDINENDGIHIPQTYFNDKNAFIKLPNDVDLRFIKNWVTKNKEMLINSGIDKSTLNRYINDKLDGNIVLRNNSYYLDIITDLDTIVDPLVAYNLLHEDIMKNEPMYVRGSALGIRGDVNITYESYY